jgi:hypothetical protein
LSTVVLPEIVIPFVCIICIGGWIFDDNQIILSLLLVLSKQTLACLEKYPKHKMEKRINKSKAQFTPTMDHMAASHSLRKANIKSLPSCSTVLHRWVCRLVELSIHCHLGQGTQPKLFPCKPLIPGATLGDPLMPWLACICHWQHVEYIDQSGQKGYHTNRPQGWKVHTNPKTNISQLEEVQRKQAVIRKDVFDWLTQKSKHLPGNEGYWWNHRACFFGLWLLVWSVAIVGCRLLKDLFGFWHVIIHIK